MPFTPRGEEVLRLAELLEEDLPSLEVATTKALEMAWGLILMRDMAMALVERDGKTSLEGPYASVKDAEKAKGSHYADKLFGPGAVAQLREGGPWIDWCRDCHHRAGDHHHTGRSDGHCLWSSCECKKLNKVPATGKKAKGAGWKPRYTWTPTSAEVKEMEPVMLAGYDSSEAMAKAVMKQAFKLMQARSDKSVVVCGRSFHGPYSGTPSPAHMPYMSVGLFRLEKVHA